MTPDSLAPGERLPARPLRVLPPGKCLVEITMRTFQGRPLLKPTRETNEAILGVLGRAQHLYPNVGLVGFWFLSNHYTMLALVDDVLAMSKFEAHVNGNIARRVGRVHGWTQHFWGRAYRAIYVSPTEHIQERRLEYLLSQGTKEGLVARPEDWIGVSSLRAMTHGEPLIGTWYDLAKEFNANRDWKPGTRKKRKRFPTRYEIKLTPLPAWEAAKLSPEKQRSECRKMLRDIERSAKRLRGGKPPLGIRKIMQQSPHKRPAKLDESPAPLSHGTVEDQKWFRDFYVTKVREHRASATRVRSGDVSALRTFPRGMFPPAIPPRSRHPRRARDATTIAL